MTQDNTQREGIRGALGRQLSRRETWGLLLGWAGMFVFSLLKGLEIFPKDALSTSEFASILAVVATAISGAHITQVKRAQQRGAEAAQDVAPAIKDIQSAIHDIQKRGLDAGGGTINNLPVLPPQQPTPREAHVHPAQATATSSTGNGGVAVTPPVTADKAPPPPLPENAN